MIKEHKAINNDAFKSEIEKEMFDFEYDGFISMHVLKLFYNLFAWLYIENSVESAFDDSDNAKKLKRIINKFNLSAFKGSSLAYSALLFYITMSRVLDIRQLEKGNTKKIKEKWDNKLLLEEDFKFKSLFNYYKNSKLDIPRNFLLFSNIFMEADVKHVEPLKYTGQVMRLTNISDIIRPDFKYKLATKKLMVNTLKEGNDNKKVLTVMQDSTLSMTNYRDKLQLLKVFILNEALTNGYNVIWKYVNEYIIEEIVYTSDNIEDIDINFIFGGRSFDIDTYLKTFDGDNLLIITDGEDNFNVPFTFMNKKINLISFNENMGLRNNILKYGRFFRYK